MKGILIYPFERTFQEILECWEYESKISMDKPTVLVPPKGWGYDSLKEYKGVKINECFEEALDECVTVLIRESDYPLDFEKIILPKVKLAAEKGKKIIYCRKSINELEILKDIIPADRLIISDYYLERHENILKRQIFNINVPVVFICGISSDTYKLRTQLLLAAAFRKEGYKVSCICCANEMEYLGENIWPSFLYKNYSSHKKILEINHYVKRIEKQEQPDIIFAIIPGEVIEISNRCVGNFGMLALEIGKALIPDCIILNTTMIGINKEFCAEMSKSIESVFSRKVDFYNCVPLLLQMQESNDRSEPVFLQLDDMFIKEQLKNNVHEDIVQIYNLKSAEKVANRIIEKLS